MQYISVMAKVHHYCTEHHDEMFAVHMKCCENIHKPHTLRMSRPSSTVCLNGPISTSRISSFCKKQCLILYSNCYHSCTVYILIYLLTYVNFHPCDGMLAWVLAVIMCLSVRPKGWHKFLSVKTSSSKVVATSFLCITVHRWIACDVRIYLKFALKVTHPFGRENHSMRQQLVTE